MAPLTIIIEPDPRFSRISDRLRHRSSPIGSITSEIRDLAEAMHETMEVERGVGLAAPQVGIRQRLIAIYLPEGYGEPDDPEQRLTLVNPEIVKAGGQEYAFEGCLSFPDLVGEVPRHTWVQVKALDITGKQLRFRARGMLARVIQHEIDHLEGILYFDRMDDINDLQLVETQETDEDEARETLSATA
jgi:peptide deformylase